MKTENRGFGMRRGIKWISLLLGVVLVCMTMFGFMSMARMMRQNMQSQTRQQPPQQSGAPDMPYQQFDPNSNYGPQGNRGNQGQQYGPQNMPYQQPFNPNQNYGAQGNQGMSVWLVDDNGDGIPDRGVIGGQQPQQSGRFAQGNGGYDSGYQPGFAQGYDNGSRNNAPQYQPGFAQGYDNGPRNNAPQYQPGFAQGYDNGSRNDAPRYQKGAGQPGQFDPRGNMGRDGQQRPHRGGGLLSLPFMLMGGLIRLAILAGIIGFGFVFLRGVWSGFNGQK